ncbi:P-loop NTPase fold protein [Apilactobacillus micheneri]|uniref:P-loop NTPase fold protein n=1 Tax=Apilactobacillus micheneri TaxID=1899430 RepID=UPI00112C61F0|nr:P-loop NTPase fold protein [Apilactobacillus micheneri]TPR48533.1 hypothetical protein DY037_06880 [Apilactobacillus micheneri]TPR52536.1 hypothetical protein DY126_01715 [Apilactobacillus micheneri]
MSKSNIEESFTNYLKSDDKMAFQIDAPWGSGKTYIVKKSLISIAKNENYIPVYISINGVNNIDTLNKRLNEFTFISKSTGFSDPQKSTNYFNGFMNIVDSGTASLPIFKDLYNSSKKFVKTIYKGESNYKNIVLFIDEFERCSIKINDLLGYLSNILERWNCKMIIISNELSDTTKFNDNYFQQKEKLINKSNSLTIDKLYETKNIIDESLKDSLSKDLLNWIKTASDNFSSKLPSYNFRTLFSILSSFKQLVVYINKLNINKDLKLISLKTAYASIFILTDVKRRGLDINHLKKKSGSIIHVLSVDTKKDKSKLDKEFTYVNEYFNLKFNNTYIPYIYFNEEIFNLVKYNIFNVNDYISDIKNVFHYSTNEVDLIASKIRNLENLDDKELLNIENNILRLSSDNLNIKNYIDIVDIYNMLKRNNLWIVNDISKNEISLKLKNKIMNLDDYRNISNYHEWIKDEVILKNVKSYVNSLRNLQKNKEIDYNLSLVLQNKFPKDKYKLNNIFQLLISKKNLFNLLNQKAINGIDMFVFSNKENISLKCIGEFINVLSELKSKNESIMMKYCIERLYKDLKELDSKDN